jgi:O-antigen ligase
MRALQVGICLLVAFAVLAHGVVEVWSVSVLECGSALLLIAWAALLLFRKIRYIRQIALFGPLLGFLLVGIVQLAIHASAAPFLTKVELLKLSACFVVFFLAVQVFREKRDFQLLAGFLIFWGFAVSLFGIVQHFASNGKIYWIRSVPDNGPFFGPYVNSNHFAGFVELIAPLGLALLLFRGVRRDLMPLTALCTIVPIGALVMSGSRGGILSFTFEVGLLVLLSWWRRSKKTRLGIFALAILASGALVAWLGAGKAVEKFSGTRPGDVLLSRRWSMLKGSAHVFLAHPALGSGMGTLVVVFPRYDSMYDGRVVDHSHNDYIEELADTGLAGGLCCFAFLYLLFRQTLERLGAAQGHFSHACHAGAAVACGGILLHSFVDFNLHIPSNLILFLLQAFVATSPCLLSNSISRKRRHAEELILHS